jgi:hypothetical protein
MAYMRAKAGLLGYGLLVDSPLERLIWFTKGLSMGNQEMGFMQTAHLEPIWVTQL